MKKITIEKRENGEYEVIMEGERFPKTVYDKNAFCDIVIDIKKYFGEEDDDGQV